MRIDARRGEGVGWFVWDCERLLIPRLVIWVDDETAQWGTYVLRENGRIAVIAGRTFEETRQERRIDIYPERRLVLFNQIEDVAADALPREVSLIA